MSKSPQVRLGELLSEAADAVNVEAGTVYRVGGVYSFGRGLFERQPILGAETKYNQLRRVQAGRFVYSKLKAWEGALAIADQEHEGLHVSSEFPTFNIDRSRIDPLYLQAVIRWEGFVQRIAATTTGIGARRERVSPGQMLRTRIPLPPLDEQRRIGALLTSVGDLLRSVQTLTGASRLRADRLRRVLIDRLCDGAPTRRIVDVLELQREPIAVEYSRVYRQVGIRSFGRGLIRYPALPGNQLSKLRFFRFPVGALIVSNIKAWEGAIALSDAGDEGRIASNRFLPYVPRKNVEIDLRFVCAYLLSDAGLALLGAASPGSADRNRTLAIERFEQLDIPVPPLVDQLQFASAAWRLGELSDAQGTRAKLRAAIVPSILNEVFSGRV